MSATRTDLWWLRLYNAPPIDVRYTMAMDRLRELGLSPQTIRPLVPQIMDAMDHHWTAYKRFVDTWLANTLTLQDWMKARIWLGREILHYELGQDPDMPVRPSSTLIRLMKSNPNEPLVDAYKQVVSRILRERLGLPYIRPLSCSDCRNLFEPRQHDQRWCSPRCRNRQTQREFRSKRSRITGSAKNPILEAQLAQSAHMACTP